MTTHSPFPIKESSCCHDAQGYTLVELMGVLLVLSTMTYMIWLKVSVSDTETNIAALNTFQKEVSEIANMTKSMCVTDATCEPTNPFGNSMVEISGQPIYTHFGYPIGWHPSQQADGTLVQLLDATHFEIQASLSNVSRAVFYLKQAHDPSRCHLNYQLSPTNQAQVMTITTERSGC